MKGNRRSSTLTPLLTLLPMTHGRELPLPPRLARLYGTFRLPRARSDFHVYSNFVSTLDGVISLQVKGHSGGGDISGFSAQDRMVMGLLRATADAVIVGSGTLAADPDHVWTPEAICPELKTDYQRLDTALRKRAAALNVIVSAAGTVDLRLPVFASSKVAALIVTTSSGAKQLLKRKIPEYVRIHAIRRSSGEIPAREILAVVGATLPDNGFWSRVGRACSRPSTRSGFWMNSFYRLPRRSRAERPAIRA